MIIDCHTHLGKNQHLQLTAKELLLSMDQAKIDKALVFASDMLDCTDDWMLEQIRPYPDRLLGVANYSHYYCGKGQQITEWYQEKKIVACKFYTGYDHYYPKDACRFLELLNEIGCPAIFHSGDCLNSIKCAKIKYAHPIHIDEVAVDYPNINFIIAHLGNPWVRDAAEVCYKNNNVYSDISGFVYGKFQGLDGSKFRKLINEFLDIASVDKLLFGTDYPISDQQSYLQVVNDIFSTKDCLALSSTNIIKAFKL